VVAAATPALAQEAVYVQRLSLPVLSDAIGYPRGVTADLHTGEIFVCDTRANRVLIFDREGLFLYQIPGGDVFTAPRDVAIDPGGLLLLVANYERRNALLELDFDGLLRREVALVGLPEGTPEPTIHSLALSPSGDRIYALDSVNLRIWIASRDGVIQASIDLAEGLSERERADVILGHVDVYGDALLLTLPLHSQVRLYQLDGRRRAAVGVRGTAPCMLAFPVAAALTESGELVILDQQRMVVLRWNVEANRCLGEHLGLGVSDGYLYHPIDFALDRSGQLFVAQGFDGRVQMFRGMPPAAPLKQAR
jgi:DNA-binding beta-propeller fold protein YncE